MTDLKQKDIFAKFTDEQKIFIKSKLRDLFDVDSIQDCLGENWTVTCYSRCLYISQHYVSNDKFFDALFEVTIIDANLHMRASVNEKPVSASSALSVHRCLEEHGAGDEMLQDFIGVFNSLEKIINNDELPSLLKTYWHD